MTIQSWSNISPPTRHYELWCEEGEEIETSDLYVMLRGGPSPAFVMVGNLGPGLKCSCLNHCYIYAAVHRTNYTEASRALEANKYFS